MQLWKSLRLNKFVKFVRYTPHWYDNTFYSALKGLTDKSQTEKRQNKGANCLSNFPNKIRNLSRGRVSSKASVKKHIDVW